MTDERPGGDPAPQQISSPDYKASVYENAMACAKAGIAVNPVRVTIGPDGKKDVRPIGPWRERSSNKPSDIEGWFGEGGQHTGAAYLIDMGKSGLVAFDPDGMTGRREWQQICVEHGIADQGIIVRTPGGGEHHIYRENDRHPISNSAKEIAPNLDTRGIGGFVIGPGSVIPGYGTERYEAAGPIDWTAASIVPDQLIQVYKAAKNRSRPAATQSGEIDLFDPPIAQHVAQEVRPFTKEEAQTFIRAASEKLAATRGGFNDAINSFAKQCSHFPTFIDRARCAEFVIRALGPVTGWIEPNHQDVATINSAYKSTENGRDWVATIRTETEVAVSKATLRDRMRARLYDRDRVDTITPPTALIEGVLDVATVAFLSGKFGTYKTFVSVAWACSVATGKAWEGREVTTPGPVLYVAAEGGSGLRSRIRSWELGQNNGARIDREALWIYDGRVKLTEPAEVEAFGELVQEIGPRLIVIDTLHKCAPGMEENSSKDMGEVFGAVLGLREESGATILLNHHTGHSGERARGSSSLEDDADTSWVVRLADGEDRSVHSQRTLVHRKAKDRELLADMDLTLNLCEETGSGYVSAGSAPRAIGALDNGIHAAALIAAMDAAGLAKNVGREAAKAALGPSIKAGNEIWADAIRQRKTSGLR